MNRKEVSEKVKAAAKNLALLEQELNALRKLDDPTIDQLAYVNILNLQTVDAHMKLNAAWSEQQTNNKGDNND